MKTIAAVLLFVAFAYGQKLDVFSSGLAEKVTAGRIECAKIESVDLKHMTRFDSYEDFPTFEELKCHSMCILSKFNLLNADHTVNLDSMKRIFKEDALKKVVAHLDECLPADKKLDTCEKTHNAHHCVAKYL